MFGARSLGELAVSLQARALDAKAAPLPVAVAEFIERYVAISSPLAAAHDDIARLAASAGIDLDAPLAAFEARTRALTACDVDVGTAQFSGEFGRALEYYTGFVFELSLEGQPLASPVAGGGRYDRLMRACGAPADVPAVGAAIHTQRLLAAVTGGAA
jgi:ATP phosphoribosyltransferase regulatory subunit